MKMHVYLRGRRTTLRLDEDYWSIFVAAVGSEDVAKGDVLEILADYQGSVSSPSEIVKAYIGAYVRNALSVTTRPHSGQ